MTPDPLFFTVLVAITGGLLFSGNSHAAISLIGLVIVCELGIILEEIQKR